MSPLVWANVPMAALFILALVGIPLWMTFRHPEKHPDHSEAHAYLRGKAALARRGQVAAAGPARMSTARAHQAGPNPQVPGRRHSGAPAPARTHGAGAEHDVRA